MITNIDQIDAKHRSISMVRLTPKFAEELLSRNYHNQRNIKKTKIKEFVDSMNNNEWDPFVGETIKLTKDGVMIDGQHRCMACSVSGKTVDVMVATGFDLSDFTKIDQGTKRSAGDGLSRFKNSNTVAAFVKLRLSYEETGLSENMFYVPQSNNKICTAATDDDEYVSSVGIKIRTTIGGGSSAAYAFLYWIVRNWNQEIADAFVSDITNWTTPLTSILSRFINRAINNKQSLRQNNSFKVLLRAWNAYRRGVQLKTIQPEKGGLFVEGPNVGTRAPRSQQPSKTFYKEEACLSTE